MTMPYNLFLVRHGESERNLANRAARRGDDSHYTTEFIERPTSRARLTPRGREQAVAAGEWLRKNADFAPTDRYYTSTYFRAMETAYLLGLSYARWYPNNDLRERSAGSWEHLTPAQRQQEIDRMPVKVFQQDPYNAQPPNGESLAMAKSRVKNDFFDTLHRECSNRNNVVAVCHGEIILVSRIDLERIPPHEFDRLYRDRDDRSHLHNCIILQYTRQVPGCRQITDHYEWMRMIVPWDLNLVPSEWRKIERRALTNDDLRQMVEIHPPLVRQVS